MYIWIGSYCSITGDMFTFGAHQSRYLKYVNEIILIQQYRYCRIHILSLRQRLGDFIWINNIDNFTLYFFCVAFQLLGIVFGQRTRQKLLLINHKLPQQMLMTNCNQVFLITGQIGVHMYPVYILKLAKMHYFH